MDIVERLRNGHKRYAAEPIWMAFIRRTKEREAAADEIERLRDAIADMKRNIRTVDRMFMKESTQQILDEIERSDEDNSHK